MSTTNCTTAQSLCAQCAPLYNQLKPLSKESTAKLLSPTTTTWPLMLCSTFKGTEIDWPTAQELANTIQYRAETLSNTPHSTMQHYLANKPDPEFCYLKIMLEWPGRVEASEQFKCDLLQGLERSFPGIKGMEWNNWKIVPPVAGQCANYARLYFFYEIAKDSGEI
ncbi:hypothetical protein BJY00DRAFT_312180 [Aspergillus carlsbadensis]|nr:hypothetical protein BJY00DRAFT_312180 [Aspergillus carlsbadensis]